MEGLAGRMNTGTASAKSEFGQQQVQLGERLHRRLRQAELHDRACGCVEHPRRHDDDDARRGFDVNDLAVGALLAVLPLHAAAVQRVPAVEDFNLLPDMGRMTQ